MFIVCEGKVAEHPYVMPYTGRKVYSLEELCCYLYENITASTGRFSRRHWLTGCGKRQTMRLWRKRLRKKLPSPPV